MWKLKKTNCSKHIKNTHTAMPRKLYVSLVLWNILQSLNQFPLPHSSPLLTNAHSNTHTARPWNGDRFIFACANWKRRSETDRGLKIPWFTYCKVELSPSHQVTLQAETIWPSTNYTFISAIVHAGVKYYRLVSISLSNWQIQTVCCSIIVFKNTFQHTNAHS